MANLNSLHVHIKTSRRNNADTDGDVYIGIAGREFRCDTTADDFEENSDRIYKFGAGANVTNTANNDPRNPQLAVEDVDRFPVYIRFEQDLTDHDGGEWNLESAVVHLNQTTTPQYESRLGRSGLWLGKTSGSFLYLRKRDLVVNP
jgi:hypothetical protein